MGRWALLFGRRQLARRQPSTAGHGSRLIRPDDNKLKVSASPVAVTTAEGEERLGRLDGRGDQPEECVVLDAALPQQLAALRRAQVEDDERVRVGLQSNSPVQSGDDA